MNPQRIRRRSAEVPGGKESDMSSTTRQCGSSKVRVRGRRAQRERGVSGILAMMFLVLFSSLAVAMAAVSQGNLRTADTHQRVIRAQGAVDSALLLAEARLSNAARRFVVAEGDITPGYALQLWNGTYASDPPVTVLPPADGMSEAGLPSGMAQALRNINAADASSNIATGITLGSPPTGWVRSDPIGLHRDAQGNIVTAVQVDYLPPDTLGRVLVVATGYEWDYIRSSWVTRTAQQYFNMVKALDHAIIAPSRIMIGRNVQVDGPLGIRYNSAALDTLDGPPLVTRSDFYGLDADLDAKLDAFYTAILADDVDGDNRLREGHVVEGANVATLNTSDFDGDGNGDSAFIDGSRDEAIDDFDVFMSHFDSNGDGQVVCSSTLTAGTPNAARPVEFTLDDRLAELIDSGKPDRNGNGLRNGDLVNGTWDFTTFEDNNGDGTLNAGDLDLDDQALGYRDGVIDYRDRYRKVRGAVYMRAARTDWEAADDGTGTAVGDYQQFLEGPLGEQGDLAPLLFEADDAEIPPVTQDSFATAAQLMADFHSESGVSSLPFDTQVSNAKGGGWTPTRVVESTPYGSPSPADWYSRPVYDNIVFRNVTIPMGTNALFRNCTFIGVTRVEAFTDNTHPSWVFYGEEQRDPITGALSLVYPPPPAASDAQLDKSYTVPTAPNYASLPDPLEVNVDVDGDTFLPDTVYNTKLLANNIRFDDCLFIGSIVCDKPTNYTHIRNKLQFTGATVFSDVHPDFPSDPALNMTSQELAIAQTSSLMAPHYSVDIGTNNSPQAQDVRLQGAVIAGVLDVRGNASIRGALLLTFEPVYGTPPLAQYGVAIGNPSQFNVTLGYFGPQDGDEEGINLTSLTDLDGDGNLDIGWDSARDAAGTLVELTTLPVQDSWFDGLPDSDADPAQHHRRAIQFNGFGKIRLELDRDLVLPDGLEAPMSFRPDPETYQEGRFTAP